MSKLLSDDELIQEIDVITDNLLAYRTRDKDNYDMRIFDLINAQKHLAYSQGVNDALFNPTGKSNAEIAARNKRLEEANQ